MTGKANETKDTARADPVTGQPLAPAIDAATLVIFRDTRAGEPPELLMVERSAKMAFAAGAAVFPGGRIDPQDHEFADALGCADAAGETAARIAAIRETLEETGLAIGFSSAPVRDEVVAARAALHNGAKLQELCARRGWRLDMDGLVPFARWRPSFAEARIFDARFYLANAGAAPAQLQVDATENRSLFWASARDVLRRADAGDLRIIYPTRRNLERLAQFASYQDAADHAQQTQVRTITPYIEDRAGMQHLCIPEGLGYPVTSEPMDRARRT